MIRKHIFSLVIAISLLIGVTYGQNDHGTHAAGTIGAVGNNGVGVQGGYGDDILVGGRTSFESQIILLGAAAVQMAATQGRGIFILSTSRSGPAV